MKSKLFSKLEMEKLSQSFKDEIEKNPEAYFLTYDMYDLLIDWDIAWILILILEPIFNSNKHSLFCFNIFLCFNIIIYIDSNG